MEPTQKTESWKNLSIRPPEILKSEMLPLTSRLQSKENIRIEANYCRPASTTFKQSNNETYRNLSSNTRDDGLFDQKLELIESKLNEINALKTKLQSSYQLKKETLRRKEREFQKAEQDFKKKVFSFDEERNKWCTHISLKLKEIKNKENELENERKGYIDQIDKAKKIEEVFFRLQDDIKQRNMRMDEFEANYDKREQILLENEEKLTMKIEDIAGYERRIIDFEQKLIEKERNLEDIAEIIERKQEDIMKTANMFEKINDQLKSEDKYVKMQNEVNEKNHERLKKEETRLKIWEKHLLNIQKEIETRENSLKNTKEQRKNSFLTESSDECNFQEFSVRTSE
ncbi:hypothetical protein SteCoe_10978 [Stentor coeruleus]|uniref:Uncharacterized protein n=1 Tax=Stentor coeruleus TaxID=5963 RepID=A0A1R2CE55_9CILI|nr:hypothetical protein SteCoe_10978 [Stentor coeruleus]